jgi:hypothetical protein
MKKILALIIIPYLALMGVFVYIFFGPGLFSTYQKLEWKGLKTNVPSGFSVKTYRNKGWEVYSMKKLTVLVNISQGPAMDVSGLPKSSRKVTFQHSGSPESIFFISNPSKNYEIVYACNVGEQTIHFSVLAASVFSGVQIIKKLTADCSLNGLPIPPPQPPIPVGKFMTDLIFLGGIFIPLLIIILIFTLAGRRPSQRHFEGDPVRFEESYVYYTSIQKYRRKGSYCHLALTSSRLLIFLFRKPVWELKLHENTGTISTISIVGKRIILQKGEEKVSLRPSDIETWREHLSAYISVQKDT